MRRRNLFMSATILCGLLAVAIQFSQSGIVWFWHDHKPIGGILGLLAAIFGSQWLRYQRRGDSAQPDKPGWLRQLLYTGLLVGCASQSGAQCFDNRSLFIDDALGYTVSSMALGDFNGDGKTDIAAAHYNANAVSVVMGDGAYNFAVIKGTSFNILDKKSSHAVGYNPTALAVGFFNNDFKPDLVVANKGNHTISVLLNKGNGDFYPAVTYPAGISPTAIAVSDFNKDGYTDIVVTNTDVVGGSVSILLNKGNGSFKLATQFKTGGPDPEAIVIGDFNGDSNPDLATSDFIDGTVSVRYGNGLGGVGGVFNYPVGKKPKSMAIRDLNGDGRPDVVVSLNGENKVAVLYTGIGIGGLFYPPVKYDVGYLPTAVCLGDIDNDGKIDILVANYNSGDISILLNQGNYFLVSESMFNGSFLSKPTVMVVGYIIPFRVKGINFDHELPTTSF
ncbi:MAG: VCBS repeat-containing protein [Spirosoma sp.]|nr:VCBS repeat-containing protein [Spirosoma sp.]